MFDLILKKVISIRDGDDNAVGTAVTIETLDDAVTLDFATGVNHAGQTVLYVVIERIIALRQSITVTKMILVFQKLVK